MNLGSAGHPDPLPKTRRYQYVWDIRYIDAPVLRDENKDPASDDTCDDGDPDERLYYCNDANFNVTALVGTDGIPVERYVYDAYGKVTIYDVGWSSTVAWDDSKKNEILYCGYRFDPETGLYHVRHRAYHPTLGRWNQRDLEGYVDGMSLYEYVGTSPAGHVDWLGARAQATTQPTTQPTSPSAWKKAKKAFGIWASINDEGKLFATELMLHYVLGGGSHYKAGLYYLHAKKTSWWSKGSSWLHIRLQHDPGEASNIDAKWAGFMKARPELQTTGRRFYGGRTTNLCNKFKKLRGKGFSFGPDSPFDWDAPHTRLNRLMSMRLTLHASGRIQVTGFWTIHYDKDPPKCTCRVEYKWVTWYWHDRGDLHGDQLTYLHGHNTVKDSDFKKIGVGKPFDITISWTDEKAEWRSQWNAVAGRYGPAERVSGWPSPTPAGTAGGKKSAPRK